MTRERLPRWLAVYCAALAVAAGALSAVAGCGPIVGLHEGGHEIVQRDGTTVASFDSDRACAQGWARRYYHDSTITYRDSESEVAAYVKVHGDAIMRWGFPVAETVAGDTIYFTAHLYDLGPFIVPHGQLHVLQERHPELKPGGDIHFPPLWGYCGIPTRFG